MAYRCSRASAPAPGPTELVVYPVSWRAYANAFWPIASPRPGNSGIQQVRVNPAASSSARNSSAASSRSNPDQRAAPAAR